MSLQTTRRASEPGCSSPRHPGRWQRLAPWGVSAAVHGLLATVAAVAVLTGTASPVREMTVAGSLLSAGPVEKVTSVRPRQYGAEPAQQAMQEVARAAESLRSVPTGRSSTELVGLKAAAGAMAELGPASGIYSAPRSSLLGAGGNATHVVFVIDRSGSMIDNFEDVRRAVLLSIGHLSSVQDFHVILFAEGRAIESGPRRLVQPTEANKLAAAAFLASARAGFQSDPTAAMNRAFDVLDAARGGSGKLIYLLSDGAFPDGPAVLALIRKRNADKQVRINTYFCGGGDAQARALLRQIAISTGGLFRQVAEQRSGDGAQAAP